jgi:SDR family mycofactocin-dependent oxidoreductase
MGTLGRFNGKVVVITGGARGQGRSHAVMFAEEGADVVIVDRPDPVASVPYPLGTKAELKETARLVEQSDRRCLVVEADVRSAPQMRDVMAEAAGELGGVDIVVANAGIATYHQLVDMDDSVWDDMIDVNLTGVANTIRAALPEMISRRSGRLVAISSQAGRRGVPNLSHYCAAKWGLVGLVKSVALEVAPFEVTCNAVMPGAVDTPMMHHKEVYETFAPELDDPGAGDLEERLRAMTPMPTTWVEASDMSHAVMYLASDEARHVSGATLDVAAGFNAGAA